MAEILSGAAGKGIVILPENKAILDDKSKFALEFIGEQPAPAIKVKEPELSPPAVAETSSPTTETDSTEGDEPTQADSESEGEPKPPAADPLKCPSCDYVGKNKQALVMHKTAKKHG